MKGPLTFNASKYKIGPAVLAGAIDCADNAFTDVGDMTFHAGSVLASGSTNGNTLLLRANDTTFLTFTTGATDTLDIGAHNISGDSTVTATKALSFGASGTKITDTYLQFGNATDTLGPKLKYASTSSLIVRGAADDADADFSARYIIATGTSGTGFSLYSNGGSIGPRSVNNYYAVLKSRDTDVGDVEVARLQGAADPYFRVGRDDTGVSLNSVTDGLYLQMAGGTGNSSAGQGFGMPFYLGNSASETEERGSIDCVLVTATNGAEDARFDFNVQAAGAAVATVMSLAGSGLSLSTYLKAHITDTDGTVEGQIWYDASEDKLKFKTAAGVETITSG